MDDNFMEESLPEISSHRLMKVGMETHHVSCPTLTTLLRGDHSTACFLQEGPARPRMRV